MRAHAYSLRMGDCAELEDLSIEAVSNHLQSRFRQGLIYTWIGSLLVALNPYKVCTDLYSERSKATFASASRRQEPHVFALGEQLHGWTLHKNNVNGEAIAVLAGETGSGKTETAKYLSEYLMWRCARAAQKMDPDTRRSDRDRPDAEVWSSRVKAATLLLEAFGNAKTICNTNSSRFGKLLTLEYENDQVSRMSIRTYLLTKGRVAKRLKGEQNFHAFYSLLNASTSDGISLHLDIELSKQVNGLESRHHAVYDHAEKPMEYIPWKAIEDAFAALRLGSTAGVVRTLLGIIYLGDIDFESSEDGTAAHVADRFLHPLKLASAYLCLDSHQLQEALTGVDVRGTRRKFRVVDARKTRDAVMMSIYQKLFEYVVLIVSNALNRAHRNGTSDDRLKETDEQLTGGDVGHPEVDGSGNRVNVSILDIYGFEGETENGIEQFLINIANEKLQKALISHVALNEWRVLESEGLSFSADPPATTGVNCSRLGRTLSDQAEKEMTSRLALIDGVVRSLHDASFAPIREDDRDLSFLSNISHHGVKVDTHGVSFTISHFAGSLVYTAKVSSYASTRKCIDNQAQVHSVWLPLS